MTQLLTNKVIPLKENSFKEHQLICRILYLKDLLETFAQELTQGNVGDFEAINQEFLEIMQELEQKEEIPEVYRELKTLGEQLYKITSTSFIMQKEIRHQIDNLNRSKPAINAYNKTTVNNYSSLKAG